MPISENFSSVLSKDFEINFMQCSPNGFLKYTDLCNILQLTAAAHSELGGISFVDMQKNNQAWVLSRMRVEIFELPKWKDIITVKTWICNLENSRSVRALEVFINNKKMIGAETFWAVFNTILRKPEPLAIPHEHFEKFESKRATILPFSLIKLPENIKFITSRKVFLSDLDFVNHVNNVKYLEWCLDLIDDYFSIHNNLLSFDMNFIKELSLNDEVILEMVKSERVTYFGVKKEDKTCFALKLNWNV